MSEPMNPEQADEIKRLAADLDRYMALANGYAEENERLRAALKSIANGTYPVGQVPSDVARAALETPTASAAEDAP